MNYTNNKHKKTVITRVNTMSILLKFGAPPTTYPEKKREYTTHNNITPFPTAVVKKML